MTALVTGASGFLGGRLTQLLAARGEQVRILARRTSRLDHLAGVPLRVIEGSLTDLESLQRAVDCVTHIFHCAACSTDWAPVHVYRDANVTGVGNLLRAAARVDSLQRFLHVSTTDVYGYPHTPCDESHPAVDVGLPYNRTKGQGEQLVWDASRDTGLPVTVVRPASIYGPRGVAVTVDIARLIRQRVMAVVDGGAIPGGFAYVDNVAEAMIAAAESLNTIAKVYNLSDGSGVTWRGYVDALADGLRLPRPWIDLPLPAAFALAGVMEAPHRYLHIPGRPLLTRHAVYLLARNQEYPAQRARDDFGFRPAVGFDEGLARSVDWLRRQSKW